MSTQLRSVKAQLAVIATTAILLVTTGCGGDSDSSGGSGKGPGGLEKTTVTVAALPLADGAGLHIAIAHKLFAKEGLKVQVKPVQQSVQALPALSKGQVDVIAGANYVTFLQAREKGTLRTCVLAEAARNAPGMMDVLVMPDSKIRKPGDLKGKRVAVNILDNIQSLTLDSVLRKDGAGLPEYRQIPFPQMGTALERHQVDAVHAVEPFLSSLRSKLKARTVVEGASSPVDGLPISGYVTTDQFAQKYPKTAAAFQRAIGAANALAAKDRTNVEKVLPGYTPLTPGQAASIGLPAYPAKSSAPQLKRLIGMMRDQGLLKKDIDPADVLFEPGK